MSFGDRLFAALAAEREKLGGAIPRSRWVEIVNGLLAQEARKPPSAPRKVNVLGKGMTDDDWYASLSKDPDYAGIAVLDEVRRCKLYFKGTCVPSRQRILRWLAKADVKAPVRGAGTAVMAGASADTPEPEDWRGLIRDDPEDGHFAEREWNHIPQFYQRRIARTVERIKAEQQRGLL
jgi:hypothetical protein